MTKKYHKPKKEKEEYIPSIRVSDYPKRNHHTSDDAGFHNPIALFDDIMLNGVKQTPLGAINVPDPEHLNRILINLAHRNVIQSRVLEGIIREAGVDSSKLSPSTLTYLKELS